MICKILMSTERPGLTQAPQQLLARGVEQLGLELPEAALSAIQLHLSLVQKWRSKINLVSIADRSEADWDNARPGGTELHRRLWWAKARKMRASQDENR